MGPHPYSESQLVEQPAIGLFAALGWQTVSARGEILGSGGTLGRETRGDVVLVDRLRWLSPPGGGRQNVYSRCLSLFGAAA